MLSILASLYLVCVVSRYECSSPVSNVGNIDTQPVKLILFRVSCFLNRWPMRGKSETV
jgi:hypothetical protein